MDETTLTVVGFGIAILVAIGTANRRTQNRIDVQGEKLEKKIDAQGEKLQEKIDAQGEKIAYLRERMAKVEGLLEGLREAITGKRAA